MVMSTVVYWSHRASPVLVWEGTYKGVNTRAWGSPRGILEAGFYSPLN